MSSQQTLIIGAVVVAALMLTTRKVVAVSVQSDAQNPNVQAFLDLIKKHESNGGDYKIIYGGKHFTDYAAHPNIRVPFMNPKTKKMDYSTAAGAYQITHPTWLIINALVSLPDFSPASQDLAAIALLKKCGALPLILAGDLIGALKAASGTWASLPYTNSKQSHITVAQAQTLYLAAGGKLTA